MMTSFSAFDEVFDNNADNLDKMAREINKQKQQYNLIKKVYDDREIEFEKNKSQLNELSNPDNCAFRCFSTKNILDSLNSSDYGGTSIGKLIKNKDFSDMSSQTSSSGISFPSSINNSLSYSNGSGSDSLGMHDYIKRKHQHRHHDIKEKKYKNKKEKEDEKEKEKEEIKKENTSITETKFVVSFSDIKEILIIILLVCIIFFIIYMFMSIKHNN